LINKKTAGSRGQGMGFFPTDRLERNKNHGLLRKAHPWLRF